MNWCLEAPNDNRQRHVPRYPSLFQINTRVWLEGLSREAGKPITLADIDDTTIDGFAERVVYREFFPRGLTALDEISEETLGARPNTSHVTARDEVRILIEALRLPIDERGKRRAAARAEWIAAAGKPLETHDLLAD